VKNAFDLYFDDHDIEAKSLHPGASKSELRGLLKVSWDDLGEDDRDQYRKKAEHRRAEQKKEAEAITESDTEEKKVDTKKKSQKGRKSAYNVFTSLNFGLTTGEKNPERIAELSVIWKTMSDEEKAPYQQEADDDNKRTLKLLESGKTVKKVSKNNKSEPYVRFCKTQHKGKSLKEFIKTSRIHWLQLSDEAKSRYHIADAVDGKSNGAKEKKKGKDSTPDATQSVDEKSHKSKKDDRQELKAQEDGKKPKSKPKEKPVSPAKAGKRKKESPPSEKVKRARSESPGDEEW